MSRDMRPRKAAPGRKSGGGTLLGLFIGLVIGVIAVAAVVWYVNKAPLPFTTTGQQPRLPPPVGSKPAGQPASRPASRRARYRRSLRRQSRCRASRATQFPRSRVSTSTRSCRAMRKQFPIPSPTRADRPSSGRRSASPPKRNQSKARRPRPSRRKGGRRRARRQKAKPLPASRPRRKVKTASRSPSTCRPARS
ncbi:MAG: hypothetical protein AW12_01520 [Candidatus Accumulibacter sp. BA-94]|nr:MAG: hypothetical protein AW12_01520 [Candidatus Accumulibacter sp. BA-94]